MIQMRLLRLSGFKHNVPFLIDIGCHFTQGDKTKTLCIARRHVREWLDENQDRIKALKDAVKEIKKGTIVQEFILGGGAKLEFQAKVRHFSDGEDIFTLFRKYILEALTISDYVGADQEED